MELEEIKKEFERYLGHPVEESFFNKCLDAYHKARRGPIGLGCFAKVGYVQSFRNAMGDDYEPKAFRFFCGKNEYSEAIRKQLIPYQFNLEFMPKMLRKAYKEIYNNEPYYHRCEWWYERFIWHYLKIGIPVDGVIGILRKHRIPVLLVKSAGDTTSFTPEGIAQNVLNHRHDLKEYDELAKPKIRITQKTIADFRSNLEDEIKRLFNDPEIREEVIREECFMQGDDKIAQMITRGVQPAGFALTLYELY